MTARYDPQPMPLAFGRSESHPMVDALLRTRVERADALNRAVDERDDMLDFALKLFDYDRDRAIASYFQNGLEQYALVKHIARWRGRPRRMLDFASGYGRLTRFLQHEKLADEITVSDILPGGMEFQASELGVHTILSKPRPEEFEAPERYDLIFVASLFTHLPAVTFTRWLQRLAGLLEPRGLLVFSVHDESIAPVRVDGIAFQSESESRVLDVEDYGSTWVTERYVRDQVETLGSGWACVRLPRALSDWQDVYVISPDPIDHAPPPRTPRGFVEDFEAGPEGARIAGWASVPGEPPDRVEIRLDDVIVGPARQFGPRADVAEWLGVPTAEVGWECTIPADAIRSFRYQVATVSAFSKGGEERILFLGTLDALRGHIARQQLEKDARLLAVRAQEIAVLSERLAVADHERHVLGLRIAAMQQSRFWKARDAWFALKRSAGLTDET